MDIACIYTHTIFSVCGFLLVSFYEAELQQARDEVSRALPGKDGLPFTRGDDVLRLPNFIVIFGLLLLGAYL